MEKFFILGVYKVSMKKSIKEKNDFSLQEYAATFAEIKKQIKEAHVKALLSVNKELLALYWFIGKTVVEREQKGGWGAQVIEKLAQDLQREFPGIKGFSRSNVFSMKAFYLAYQPIVQEAPGQLQNLPVFTIPWWHNVILLTKVKDNQERLWYAQKALENGWSGSTLNSWITSGLYHRDGKAITNFLKTLPVPDSDMAQQSFKDPYIFDFLTLHSEHAERDLEQGLMDNIQRLLLEMGKGFAFVGRQYHLEISNKDYYIDLLFYHYKLRCFIVVELKAREFDPRDAGQINFYLSAVDDLVRGPEDKSTIGLLLCKTKDNFTAEYALRNLSSPIGIAEYETEILKKLPKELKSSLPTVEEIEAEFERSEALEEQEHTHSKKEK